MTPALPRGSPGKWSGIMGSAEGSPRIYVRALDHGQSAGCATSPSSTGFLWM